MKVLLVSATAAEVGPTIDFLTENCSKMDVGYALNSISINHLVTGVGLTSTAFELGVQLTIESFDLVIHAGIAGALDRDLSIGTVYQVVSEQFADMGAEDANGQFLDVFQLNLIEANAYPYRHKQLINPSPLSIELEKVSGYSINKVTGTQESINQLQMMNAPQIESMEGAAFFYACLRKQVPFGAIRSISNYVEPRNKEHWNIPLAIRNVNDFLINFFVQLRP